MLYPLLTRHLDEAALIGGAGAYSLLMQHFGTWFTDQRKWLDALYASWLNDPEYAASNAAALSAATQRWLPQIIDAVNDYAAAIDAVLGVDAARPWPPPPPRCASGWPRSESRSAHE